MRLGFDGGQLFGTGHGSVDSLDPAVAVVVGEDQQPVHHDNEAAELLLDAPRQEVGELLSNRRLAS